MEEYTYILFTYQTTMSCKKISANLLKTFSTLYVILSLHDRYYPFHNSLHNQKVIPQIFLQDNNYNNRIIE